MSYRHALVSLRVSLMKVVLSGMAEAWLGGPDFRVVQQASCSMLQCLVLAVLGCWAGPQCTSVAAQAQHGKG